MDGGEKTGIQGSLPSRLVVGFKWPWLRSARVAEDDVGPTHRVVDSGDEGGALARTAYVARKASNFSRLRELGDGPFELVLIPPVQGDSGPFSQQSYGDRVAKAARASAHESNASLQSQIHRQFPK